MNGVRPLPRPCSGTIAKTVMASFVRRFAKSSTLSGSLACGETPLLAWGNRVAKLESIRPKTGLHIRDDAQQGPELRLPTISDCVVHRTSDDAVVGEDIHVSDGRVRSVAKPASVAQPFVRRI